MLIRTIRPSDVPESDTTPEGLYLKRRQFLHAGAAGLVLAAGCSPGEDASAEPKAPPPKVEGLVKSPYSTDEELTARREELVGLLGTPAE